MIDLVTIVFKEELDYLRTQAESVSLYVPVVNNIYVIVNDDDDVCTLINTAWWGQHSGRVKIIPYSTWKYKSNVLGWENQQLCKLLAARDAESSWSMSLDSKTWFVQTLDYNKLFDSMGRATMGTQKVVPVFQSSKEFVEKLFDVEMSSVIGPAGVPFMFHTDTVKSLFNEIDNFIEFFLTNVRYPNFLTEFYLYSGYVLRKCNSYETLYNKTHYYTCCNIADFDVPEFDQHFSRMSNEGRLLTASIHRRAYPLLSPEQLELWAGFLSKRKLNTVSNWRQKWHSSLTLP